MTIQLELNFLSTYAFSACSELRGFAVSVSHGPVKDIYLPRYKALQGQATDLKNYAFFHGYIDADAYAYLSNSILDSSDLFWS